MLSSVLSFLRQVVPGGEPVTVAGALAEAADRLWGAKLALVWHVDGDSGHLQLRHISGADRRKAEGVVRADEPLVQELVRLDGPIVIWDLARDSRWGNRDLLELTGHRALLGAPMIVDGQSVGAFVLLCPSPDRFSHWDEAVLEVFARHLAGAREQHRAREDLKEARDRLVRAERYEVLANQAVGKAHDLNNFLGLILGNLYLLRMKLSGIDEEAIGLLDLLERTVMDATGTVRRLYGLASGRASGPRVTWVDLNEVAEDVLQLLRAKLKESLSRGIHIEVQMDLQLQGPVLANPALLREALVNVMLNSIQAMPEGGKLTLRTWEGTATVHLTVSDTGVGMSPEIQSRMFEPFFTSRGEDGVGMGMAMTYDLIKSQQGAVEVASEEGRGTTVTISLPKAVPGR